MHEPCKCLVEEGSPQLVYALLLLLHGAHESARALCIAQPGTSAPSAASCSCCSRAASLCDAYAPELRDDTQLKGGRASMLPHVAPVACYPMLPILPHAAPVASYPMLPPLHALLPAVAALEPSEGPDLLQATKPWPVPPALPRCLPSTMSPAAAPQPAAPSPAGAG